MDEENKRKLKEDKIRDNEGKIKIKMGLKKGENKDGKGGFGKVRNM